MKFYHGTGADNLESMIKALQGDVSCLIFEALSDLQYEAVEISVNELTMA